VDVWWRVLLISVRDDSWVVGRLRPCHPVSGGLRLWAVFGLELAQLVEHKALNLVVVGSSPTVGAKCWNLLTGAS
jgi:hypothetical protein